MRRPPLPSPQRLHPGGVTYRNDDVIMIEAILPGTMKHGSRGAAALGLSNYVFLFVSFSFVSFFLRAQLRVLL